MGHTHNHSGHHHNIIDRNNNLNKIASYCSLIAVSVIIIAKIIGWYLTDSLTILASLADSMLDIGTSIINFIAIRYALLPADDNHKFGHNKAEDLAVFTQSSFFLLSGFFVIINAVKRFYQPELIDNIDIGLYLMYLSLAVTFILTSFQRYVIKKTHSNIVKADYLHYIVDLLSNLAVILSLYLSEIFDSELIDPIVAILIGIYIFYGASSLIKKAFKNLMDHEFDQEDKEKLFNAIHLHPEVKAVNEVKTRYAGTKAFIQFILELDGNMSLFEADRVVDEIEEAITKIFPHSDIIIHQHPYGIEHGTNKRANVL